MTKTTTPNTASISIVRSKGFGTCRACRYTIGARNPRGELFLQVARSKNGSPHTYHFGCYAAALADYEEALSK